MGRSQKRSTKNTTTTRKIGRNHNSQHPNKKKRKRAEIVPGGEGILVEIYRNKVNKHGYNTRAL